MNTLIRQTRLELAKRALYQLPESASMLVCLTGTLWVTRDNDLRDTILKPGERFAVDGRHKVIAYALDPATFSVQTEHPAPAPAPLQRKLRSPAARGLVME